MIFFVIRDGNFSSWISMILVVPARSARPLACQRCRRSSPRADPPPALEPPPPLPHAKCRRYFHAKRRPAVQQCVAAIPPYGTDGVVLPQVEQEPLFSTTTQVTSDDGAILYAAEAPGMRRLLPGARGLAAAIVATFFRQAIIATMVVVHGIAGCFIDTSSWNWNRNRISKTPVRIPWYAQHELLPLFSCL
jgi:hypothetical protein